MVNTSPEAAWARAARCRLVDHWAAEVVTELQRRGIRPVLLKGPVLARWLYAEDPALRTYVDVDLLVPPDDRAGAEAALRALGFTSTVPLRPRHAIQKHADEWLREPDGAAVDLHVAIHGTERLGGTRLWDAVSAGTERWTVDGVEVEVPGLVARTLHVVLNLLPDDPLSSKPAEDLRRAVALVDLATWEAAVELARHLEATDEMGAKLARLPAGAELAERLGLPTAPLEHLFPVSQHASVPVLGLWHLRSLPTTRARAEYVRDVFLPPAAFLQARWPVARRGPAALAAARVAWVLHSVARGAWALRRIAALRRQWKDSQKGRSASGP